MKDYKKKTLLNLVFLYYNIYITIFKPIKTSILTYILQGLLLGIAYVAPIGVQNIYVINNSILQNKRKAYLIALIIAFFDISLAFACFYGVGLIIERFEILKLSILLLGSIAMVIISIKLIVSKQSLELTDIQNQSLKKIIITSMIVTWFNPQALIDGTLLLGGFKASLSSINSIYFIIGVSLSSLSWFLILTTLVSKLKKSFNNKTLKIINIICGIIIMMFGIKLGYTFIISL